MTGREMIVYILENHLEDEEMFKDGKPIGFLTVAEAAVKLKTGMATVILLYELGKLSGVKLGNEIYIYDSKGGSDEKIK